MPALAMPAPEKATDQRVRAAGGDARDQVMMFQPMAPISAPKMTWKSRSRGDDARSQGLRDMKAEHGKGDEIEEAAQTTAARREDARRHDGGDGIGGIMKAVHEVEQQRQGDKADQCSECTGRVHGPARPSRCSTTMPWISFATLSKLSTTWSRCARTSLWRMNSMALPSRVALNSAACGRARKFRRAGPPAARSARRCPISGRRLRRSPTAAARPREKAGGLDERWPTRAFPGRNRPSRTRRSLCRLVHLIDGVIHAADQVADVDAIDRRDETRPHAELDFARHGVSLALELADGMQAPGRRRHCSASLPGHRPPFDKLRVPFE